MGHCRYYIWDLARKQVFEVYNVRFDEGVGKLKQARADEELSGPLVPTPLSLTGDLPTLQSASNFSNHMQMSLSRTSL
jgi:hypothetical protein